jgi:hypothetical protein
LFGSAYVVPLVSTPAPAGVVGIVSFVDAPHPTVSMELRSTDTNKTDGTLISNLPVGFISYANISLSVRYPVIIILPLYMDKCP